MFSPKPSASWKMVMTASHQKNISKIQKPVAVLFKAYKLLSHDPCSPFKISQNKIYKLALIVIFSLLLRN